jgi:hypothetical protein
VNRPGLGEGPSAPVSLPPLSIPPPSLIPSSPSPLLRAGRAVLGDDDVPSDEAHWFLVENPKVSKKHATIRWDAAASTLRLKCHGRNGLVYNRACAADD